MFPCLLSASLFKVQVNLSWWLAVWSQEVDGVRERGCEEWSVVEQGGVGVGGLGGVGKEQ